MFAPLDLIISTVLLTSPSPFIFFFFFFNDTATTEIYTLSLHDALPISRRTRAGWSRWGCPKRKGLRAMPRLGDRKSTRLNSSHVRISYAVFCLKKKTNTDIRLPENTIDDRANTTDSPAIQQKRLVAYGS